MDSLARIFKKGNFTSFQFVYGCVPVYRHNVSPLFHVFTAAQLNIDTPISCLILIFIRCGMCWVFAQRVTIVNLPAE